VKLGALLVLAALSAACAQREPADAQRDPAAPFFGPAERAVVPAQPPPRPVDPVAAIAAPPPPLAPPISDDAARRREAWTSSRFRCRAISTTRLRTCRFDRTPTGVSITFPIADLTCAEVVFDSAGDPAELRGCSSTWLRVPATASLKRSRTGDVWSGGHAGWRWPGDGERYCCPGLWIEAPASLRGR
jgi:hypothetical protein